MPIETDTYYKLQERVTKLEQQLTNCPLGHEIKEKLSAEIEGIKSEMVDLRRDIEILFKKSETRTEEMNALRSSLTEQMGHLREAVKAIEVVLQGYGGEGGIVERFAVTEKRVLMLMGAIAVINTIVPVLIKVLWG